ncbi:MAG TPA: hypothetical protein DGL25_01925 [Dehalococcoidia bacterium]|nr:hypothetical protein [Dehalococcoidia bacterium]
MRARPSSRARSDAHSRLPIRIGLHLLLVGMAALAAVLTTHLITEAEPFQISSVPSSPLSGVRAIAPTDESFLRPGVSHKTRESPLRGTLPGLQVAQLRPTENVATDETLSDGVADAAAASSDQGYELRPLTERIDPTVPYVLYVVRAGDTLSEIADTYETTIDNILLNNAEVAEGGWIAPGEEILVPLGQVPGILYLVGYADSIYGIVENYLNVTVQDVINHRANNLTGGRDLQAGEYVLLPNAEPKPPPVYSDNGVILGYYGIPDVSPGRFSLPLPVWGFVSDWFGTDRGHGRIHTGIDLALGAYPASSIYAACDGWVSRTEWLTYSYGYYVIVDCGDGWETLYSHFSEILVSWGQRVTKGETILGISGSTGFSTGEHLHFEIRYNGAALDPENYIDFSFRW